ncbi:helix-turn-helix transcriptional regulator [Sphingomonas sp. HDW15A]|uniref:winged helix-turn-helix transcriptional regulator n=1 Tax=Sphingomonas sp. HDW15A TaxID=2714942 RepID=UPI00140C5591|nr:helix-turn-helix domain-containing protein [Sphingomonas sp. HDW15A]QIK96816.1 helix-turn-helix transcriptional regulator [Sphingomonas sp. HDW15A]
MQSEKITRERRVDEKRRYDDACGTAHGLELIGERWALLVLRELMLGPRRFSQLRADLPGISANVLTQRLTELENRGLVVRRRLPPPANVQVYEATEWGLEAEPIVQALGRWAARSPSHDPTLPISGVSILLSMRTMFDRSKVKDMKAKINFRFGPDSYVAHIHEGQIDIVRGEAADAALTVAAQPPANLAAIMYGGAPYELIQWSGDKALLDRFVDLFELPPRP